MSLQRVLVVGSRHHGKTAYLRALVARARAADLRVRGFLTEAAPGDTHKRALYLREIGGALPPLFLGATSAGPGLDLRVGSYYLSSATFARAEAVLSRSLDADLICLDEIGPLELRGGGFSAALARLLESYRGILVLTTRPALATMLLQLLQRSAAGAPGAGAPAAAGRCPG